jgi:hypothetical protein
MKKRQRYPSKIRTFDLTTFIPPQTGGTILLAQNAALLTNKLLNYYEGRNPDTRPDLNLSTSRLVQSEQLRAHAKI